MKYILTEDEYKTLKDQGEYFSAAKITIGQLQDICDTLQREVEHWKKVWEGAADHTIVLQKEVEELHAQLAMGQQKEGE
jgi:benzoyl-CoA reductase/2-hydroxyglutaryl-CoA dehydratase subunit BcrC/BadD/HgdB